MVHSSQYVPSNRRHCCYGSRQAWMGGWLCLLAYRGCVVLLCFFELVIKVVQGRQSNNHENSLHTSFYDIKSVSSAWTAAAVDYHRQCPCWGFDWRRNIWITSSISIKYMVLYNFLSAWWSVESCSRKARWTMSTSHMVWPCCIIEIWWIQTSSIYRGTWIRFTCSCCIL